MKTQSPPTRIDTALRTVDDIRQQEAELFVKHDSFGVMQLAAHGVFDVIQQQSKDRQDQRRAHIVLGCGNNAGDGLVTAVLLKSAGWSVHAYTVFGKGFTGDALKALNMALAAEVPITAFEQFTCHDNDIIVEALFGVGLDRPVTGDALQAIQHINQCKKDHPNVVVYAIDTPAGILTDTGLALGEYVVADYTVTFIADKVGIHTANGKGAAGNVILKDLGTNNSRPLPAYAFLYDYQQRHDIDTSNQNKGDFGHALIVGGNQGMFGATALAAVSSLKSGAGKSSIYAHPDYHSQYHLENTPLYEVMRCDDLGDVSPYTSIVLGPGLGSDEWGESQFHKTIETLEATSDKQTPKLLIDADGLLHLARYENSYPHVDIITPHEAEAAQLLNTSVETIRRNKISVVRNLALRYQCVAVLKGAGTLISDGQRVWINTTGNVNLATAGTGDTLAGLIGGYAAQGYSSLDAALYGVYRHGSAADAYAHKHPEKSLRATELWDYL